MSYDHTLIGQNPQSRYISAEPSARSGDVGPPRVDGLANQEDSRQAAPAAIDVSFPQLTVYRVFFSVEQNARVADEQSALTEEGPIRLVRTVREGPAITRWIETLACPSCGRTYSLNVNGPSVDFRCVKCGNLMLIVSRAW